MNIPKLLKLDLQHFSDDINDLRAEFEAEWKDTDETDEIDSEETGDELDSEDDVELDEEETEEYDDSLDTEDENLDDESDEESEEVQTSTPNKQTKEENAAFAQMRREKEALEAQNRVLEQVAASYNMTVEEFQTAYAAQQEEEAAKKENVPVEFFRKSNENEQRLLQLEKEAATTKYDAKVKEVQAQYGLEDKEVHKVFDYLMAKGLHNPRLGIPSLDFDLAYKALNFDEMLARKTTETKQKMLADKKKRQKNSAKPHSNTNVSTASNDEITDKFVEDRLRSRGLI